MLTVALTVFYGACNQLLAVTRIRGLLPGGVDGTHPFGNPEITYVGADIVCTSKHSIMYGIPCQCETVQPVSGVHRR